MRDILRDRVPRHMGMEIFNTAKKKQDYFMINYLNSHNPKVLYIHIPFCVSKCKYCVCQSYGNRTKEDIANYVSTVIVPQFEQYARILEDVEFDQLYIGGGTPTILSCKQLNELLSRIPNIDRIPIKCIEASPDTLNLDHINLLKEFSFDFLSVGIQTISKKLCNKHNRFFLSEDALLQLSSQLRDSGLYINYDLIAFLDHGDIRDLPEFRNELRFILDECRPTSVTIHQLQQSFFSEERSLLLIKLIRNELMRSQEYECINSELLDTDALYDTVFQAEYRLVRDNRDFHHYMWNKYAGMPVQGYDILSLGYNTKIHTISNANTLIYSPGENKLKQVKFEQYIYDDYEQIRLKKGLSK